MHCDQFRQNLNPFLDGELDAALSHEMESHPAGCDPCAAEYSRKRALRQTLKSIPVPPPEPLEPGNADQKVETDAATGPGPSFAAGWEVDRFTWPPICQQLFVAEAEFLEQTGRKLLAANRDGLNVLAICSARRGEGRTTLALCLASSVSAAGAAWPSRKTAIASSGPASARARSLRLPASSFWRR